MSQNINIISVFDTLNIPSHRPRQTVGQNFLQLRIFAELCGQIVRGSLVNIVEIIPVTAVFHIDFADIFVQIHIHTIVYKHAVNNLQVSQVRRLLCFGSDCAGNASLNQTLSVSMH